MSDWISSKTQMDLQDNSQRTTRELLKKPWVAYAVGPLIVLCIFEKVGYGISILAGVLVFSVMQIVRQMQAHYYQRERGLIMQNEIIERLMIIQNSLEK